MCVRTQNDQNNFAVDSTLSTLQDLYVFKNFSALLVSDNIFEFDWSFHVSAISEANGSNS